MFPENEEPQEECTFTEEYVAMLNAHPLTNEGLDFHMLGHMLFVVLFNLRQMLTPIQLATYTTSLISRIEEGLAAHGYRVDHPDYGVRTMDTPEWRAKTEADLSNLVIPDDLSELYEGLDGLFGNTDDTEDVEPDDGYDFTIDFTPDEGTET